MEGSEVKHKDTGTQELAMKPEEDVLESDDKREKLLRLLGGKKISNESAAKEWITKTRSSKDEEAIKEGLEAQYQTSLSHRLSGAARRHEGIGFEKSSSKLSESEERSNSSSRRRSRSRSPIKSHAASDDKRHENDSAHHESPTNTDNKSCKPAVLDKKNFYMQFTKAKE
ncbi:uncharacterized protein LOC143468448 [Clavelina lepadiformis]|uniref:Small acidic protein n=1 Tax=Clavelina lepadiformis TaxID=159417 RepID=A0ABP0F0Z9_CLALP